MPVREDVVATLLTMTKPSSTMSVSSIDDRPAAEGGRLPKLPRRPVDRPVTHVEHFVIAGMCAGRSMSD